MTRRIMVVAATRAEAAYVPAHLPLVITGMGKTAAATATTRALVEAGRPDEVLVVNIGTCGALRPGLSGLHEPGTVINHDVNAEVIRQLGYDPQERLEVGDSAVVLATGDVFVSDGDVRDRLAQRAHLVDMEGYAVAWAAQRLGAHVRLVKYVSDEADEGAMDWPDLVDRSARSLGQWLEANL